MLKLLLCLLFAGTGQITEPPAQPPPPPPPAVELPFSLIRIDVGDLLQIKPKSSMGKVRWFVSPKTGGASLPCGDALHFAAKAEGEYIATAFTVVKGEISDPFEVRIIVGHGPRPPPVPPDPKPPVPPEPPTPPAPIPAAGFRVLIVEDPVVRDKLPPAQAAIITSGLVRDYLDAKCAPGPGNVKEWRIWPSGADVSAQPALWRAAYQRPRASLPWIIISNGTIGTEEPLPLTVADTLKLLKKYGGD